MTRRSGVCACGETQCKTPNFDRLAREGVLFKTAYATMSACSPARATVMTGFYSHSQGVCSITPKLGCSVHEIQDQLR
ncbi:sulfatase-like hydrolase/transferase [Candidatus Hydrogenedentota bacterium]